MRAKTYVGLRTSRAGCLQLLFKLRAVDCGGDFRIMLVSDDEVEGEEC